jgi:DeoR/GlpR family transcriptional regulator of sugar metabolism
VARETSLDAGTLGYLESLVRRAWFQVYGPRTSLFGAMKADERQRQILIRARADGRVDVGSLATDLDVAAETVRRDLRELVGRGVLQRVHGGAYPVESAGFESNIKHRSTSLVGEKRRIAAAAVERLHGAETVYIDEGVTPQFVAEAMRPENPVTVVTSSLLAAGALADASNITVLLLGGRMRGRTLATVDHWAVRMLQDLVIDLAFLGANGISRDHGLTTPDPAVAAVKGEVVARSRRRVFVGLHTKFGAASFCRFADVSDFEVLVTDTGLSTGEARRFSVLGPQVVRA